MVVTVHKAKELAATNWGVCMAIYGVPGVGKTTLVSEAEYSEFGSPTEFIDCEGGARAITHIDDITVLSIIDTSNRGEGFADVKKLLNDYIEKRRKANTIIIDNMSELQNMCVKWVVNHVSRGENVKPIDRPDIKDWSTITAEMLSLTRRFRDFARNSGTNVFFIAWEAPEKDESQGGLIRRDLAFNPSFARQFPGIVDVVGRLTVKGDWRELSFAPSSTTASKFRRGGGEKANNVPNVIRYKLGDKPIVDILACLKGGKPWPANKYTRGNAAIAANSQQPAQDDATSTPSTNGVGTGGANQTRIMQSIQTAEG